MRAKKARMGTGMITIDPDGEKHIYKFEGQTAYSGQFPNFSKNDKYSSMKPSIQKPINSLFVLHEMPMLEKMSSSKKAHDRKPINSCAYQRDMTSMLLSQNTQMIAKRK